MKNVAQKGEGSKNPQSTVLERSVYYERKLTCTAEDMLPLAEATGFTGGSFREYDGRLHKWNDRDRAQLMAELDAAYFHLYGLDRDDAAYVLSTFKGIDTPDPLLSGNTTAQHILDTFDHLAAHALTP